MKPCVFFFPPEITRFLFFLLFSKLWMHNNIYRRLGKCRTKLHIVSLYTKKFFKADKVRFLVGVSISNSQKLLEWIDGSSGKGFACICRRHKRGRFDPWVGKIPWRRKWQPTPILLIGESHGQKSLVGYSPWGSQRVRHNWETEHTAHIQKSRRI